MEAFNCKNTHYEEFFRLNEDLLNDCQKILLRRRNHLSNLGLRIFPRDSLIFEVLEYIKLEDIKLVIILPRPYGFESGSGVPCLIRDPDRKIPPSITNLQKAFKISPCDFRDVWGRRVLLYNISLTEEENSPVKIPHEIFWSRLFERFIEYICEKREGIVFCLSGANCGKYRNLINTSRGHTVKEIPSISDPEVVDSLVKAMEALEGL